MKNVLEKTRTYLVGHMQYADGRNWRDAVEEELGKLNITVFNPYKKPLKRFIENLLNLPLKPNALNESRLFTFR